MHPYMHKEQAVWDGGAALVHELDVLVATCKLLHWQRRRPKEVVPHNVVIQDLGQAVR